MPIFILIAFAVTGYVLLRRNTSIAQVSAPSYYAVDASGNPVQQDEYVSSPVSEDSTFADVEEVAASAVSSVSAIVSPDSTMNITSDPSTWPSGDLIWQACQAVAHAEGADVPNSNPDRLNNPGDISDFAGVYGYEPHSGSKVTVFPSKEIGWQKLYWKLSALAGQRQSSVFSPNMTWLECARAYAGNWQNWVNNVTSALGVSPNDRCGNFFGV